MRPFGLTGNMGCGKSTVASLLSKYPDVITLNCDHIAKEIISSGTHKERINAVLGRNVFLGEMADFQAVARIIFEQPQIKREFESLIHPLVWAAVEKRLASIGDDKICIVESAILFETNSAARFAAIIVASCSPREQLRRLQKNRHIGAEQIQTRLDHQLSSSEKERRAQFVIQTDCSIDRLTHRVQTLYCYLKSWTGASL